MLDMAASGEILLVTSELCIAELKNAPKEIFSAVKVISSNVSIREVPHATHTFVLGVSTLGGARLAPVPQNEVSELERILRDKGFDPNHVVTSNLEKAAFVTVDYKLLRKAQTLQGSNQLKVRVLRPVDVVAEVITERS